MQRNVLRALLLALVALIVGALPAAAQTDDGWIFVGDEDQVIIAAQRDVVVAADEVIEGLAVFKGDARVGGKVDTLFAVESDVIISGPEGAVERIFTIGGSLTADDEATLSDVYYMETDLFGVSEASVAGELVDAKDELAVAFAALAMLFVVVLLFIIIGAVIATFALTLLVIAFGTNQTRRAAATIGNDVLKTVVVGVLMLFVPALVIAVLFATIVGIPLAIALALLWGVVFFLGQIVVATWIGERILPRARTANRPYGAAFLGMLILILLSWTSIVPLLAAVFGTGAVTLAGWRMLRGGGVPPVPPGYSQPYGQPAPAAAPTYAPPPYAPPPYAPPQAGGGQAGGQQAGWPPQDPQQGGWPPQDGQPPNTGPQG